MQGIFQKENTDKALKYGIYRHLPTYEKDNHKFSKFLDKKILDYEKKVEEILKSHRGGEQEERTYNFLKEGANSKNL